MASGAFEFGTGNASIIGRCEWSSSSNGAVANSSNVSVNVYFRRTNAYATSYGTINTGVQVDAQSQWESGFSISIGTGWVISFSRTFHNVPHNSDGSKACYIRVVGNANFSLSSFDANTSVWLDKIPRYTTISTWEPTSIGQNYADFKWATTDTVDFARVYLDNSNQQTDIPGSISTTSGTFRYIGMTPGSSAKPTTSTLKPGTTYNLKIQVRRKDSQLWTISGNKQFTTTPIASLTNTSINFNIGSNLVLTFKDYNNNKSFLALDIKKVNGTWEENVVTVDEVLQASSYAWNLSSVASTLYAKVSTRNSTDIRIRCGTTIDGIKYQNELFGIMNVINSNPTFSTYSYGNAHSASQSVLGNTSYMPEGYGDMQAHISVANKAVAKNGASIIKYSASIYDSANKVAMAAEVPYSSTAQVNFRFGFLKTAGTYTMKIHAIDSRGNISSVIPKTFYVIKYHIPNTTIVLKRKNDYEPQTEITINSNYSKLMIGTTDKNSSFTIKYRYAEAGKAFGSTYTTLPITSTSSGNDKIVKYVANPFVNLNDNSIKTFNFEFVIADKLGSYTDAKVIDQGIPLSYQSDTGHYSIGMLPDVGNTAKLQVATDIMATDSGGSKKLVLNEIKTTQTNLATANTKITTANTNIINIQKDITSINGTLNCNGTMLINCGEMPNGTLKRISTNIVASRLWIREAWVESNDGNTKYPMPYVDVNNWSNSVKILIAFKNQIEIHTTANWAGYIGYVVIAYKL